jgi:SpoVK/Ycf46/Vps4 family AAA+-type ATPase
MLYSAAYLIHKLGARGITGRLQVPQMPSASQILSLLKSHASKDDARFYATAMEVAAEEARQGHGAVARELRAAIDDAKSRKSAVEQVSDVPVPLVQPRGDLANLLTVHYTKDRLSDLVLAPRTRSRLQRVLTEQRQRARLEAHGLRPRQRLLLIGPPGSGKTMTARVLAGELHLPLFTIKLEVLITKFMGETAAKLRLIFEAMTQTRGVYFFDEFDAVGSRRASGNDVGEIRRVLNSFLMLLEQTVSPGLTVAATNHPELLDPALFRRFDDTIEYSLPSKQEIVRIFKTRLALFPCRRVDWVAVAARARGLSQSEIGRIAEEAAKTVVLADEKEITTKALTATIGQRIIRRR